MCFNASMPAVAMDEGFMFSAVASSIWKHQRNIWGNLAHWVQRSIWTKEYTEHFRHCNHNSYANYNKISLQCVIRWNDIVVSFYKVDGQLHCDMILFFKNTFLVIIQCHNLGKIRGDPELFSHLVRYWTDETNLAPCWFNEILSAARMKLWMWSTHVSDIWQQSINSLLVLPILRFSYWDYVHPRFWILLFHDMNISVVFYWF